MFRPTEIKTQFANLLGWRQDVDPSKEIEQELTDSYSGQFYQDIHSLITLNNLRSVAPSFDDIDYPAWGNTTDYLTGKRVEYDSIDYKALQDNTGAQPDTSTNDWKVYDPFSEWLEQKTQASNLKALQSIYTKKVADKTANNVFQQKALFDGIGRMKDAITNTNNLVGFEIVPIRSLGATLKIESIGLQFKGTGDVTLYLFHSSRNEPLKTITIARTRNNGMEWFSQSDLYLPYQSLDNDAGGSWYLCYEQNETNSQEAINKLRRWDVAPCSSCNNYDVRSYQAWSPYMYINPFKFDSLGGNLEMWDIDRNLYTYSTNYGINLKVSVECDPTDIFVENKLNFQTVVGLQMAHDAIELMASNPDFQINRTGQNFNRGDFLYELNGNAETGDIENSLSHLLRTAQEAVSVDLTNMSRACFVCKPSMIRKTTLR